MIEAKRKFAVIGDPVSHSLSPSLFRILFSMAGVDADYQGLRVTPDQLGAAVGRVRRGDFEGLSVTLPHKERIGALLDDLDPVARRIGAVNCVTRTRDGRLEGHNTDVAGLRASVVGGPGTAIASTASRRPLERWVILGAGGAARAAVLAALDFADSILIANRTRARADSLAREGREWLQSRPLKGQPDSPVKIAAAILDAGDDALMRGVHQADIVINATSVGLDDGRSNPLPETCAIRPGTFVVDMVYRPLTTSLLRDAGDKGAFPIDGLWMLVYQALEQWRLWTGRSSSPDVAGHLHQALAAEAR